MNHIPGRRSRERGTGFLLSSLAMEDALKDYLTHLERAGLTLDFEPPPRRNPDVRPGSGASDGGFRAIREFRPDLRIREMGSREIHSDHATTAMAEVMLEPARTLAGARWLEVGCGTGVLSILAARRGARVTATDLDADALALAADNARENRVDLDLRQGSLLEPLEPRERFRWIVANLPQKPAPKADLLPLANWGGPEGDALLEGLFENAARHLEPQGEVLFFVHSLPHPRFLARLQKRFALRPLCWYLRWTTPGEFGPLGEVFRERARKGVSHLHREGDDVALVCCIWSARPGRPS